MDVMIKRVPALAAAKCLREMDTSDVGGVFAAALALRQVVGEFDSTLTEFAGWIEGWDRFERRLEQSVPDAASRSIRRRRCNGLTYQSGPTRIYRSESGRSLIASRWSRLAFSPAKGALARASSNS
jgi:hypothetical protein